MSKSAHQQSFYRSQIQHFYCGRIFDHATVSRITLAHVKKMAAHAGEKDDCVLCFRIFCKKTTCLVRNRIIHAKMININTKIKKTFAAIPHGIF